MYSFKQDVGITFSSSPLCCIRPYSPGISFLVQFDLWCWLVGFYDLPSIAALWCLRTAERLPMETGLYEVLSVPFFLLSLPSAPTSVSSSFVMAVQGGWRNCWLGHAGLSVQIVAVHSLDLLCTAERMWVIFLLLCITTAAGGPKQTQGPLCLPSWRQKSYPMKHQNAQDGHWVKECPATGGFPLLSCILGWDFSHRAGIIISSVNVAFKSVVREKFDYFRVEQWWTFHFTFSFISPSLRLCVSTHSLSSHAFV